MHVGGYGRGYYPVANAAAAVAATAGYPQSPLQSNPQHYLVPPAPARPPVVIGGPIPGSLWPPVRGVAIWPVPVAVPLPYPYPAQGPAPSGYQPPAPSQAATSQTDAIAALQQRLGDVVTKLAQLTELVANFVSTLNNRNGSTGGAGGAASGGAATGGTGGSATSGPATGGSAATGPVSGGNASVGPVSGGNTSIGPVSGGTTTIGPINGGSPSSTGGAGGQGGQGGQGGNVNVAFNGIPLQIPRTSGDININIHLNAGAGSGTTVTTSGGGITTTTPIPAGVGGASGMPGSTSGAGGAFGGAGTGAAGAGAGGAGGTGGTGGSGGATSGPVFSGSNFTGLVDLGRIVINGVETNFGILDARAPGGVRATDLARYLANALNANENNSVMAQTRDHKVLLTSKIPGSTIVIDDVVSDSDGLPTNNAFTGFFRGMTGTGTLFGNGVLPHQ